MSKTPNWRTSPVSGLGDDLVDGYDNDEEARTPTYLRDSPLTDGTSTPRMVVTPTFTRGHPLAVGTPPGTPPYLSPDVPTATPKKPATRNAQKRDRMLDITSDTTPKNHSFSIGMSNTEMESMRKGSFHDLTRFSEGRPLKEFLSGSEESAVETTSDSVGERKASGSSNNEQRNSGILTWSSSGASLSIGSSGVLKRRDSGFLSRLPSGPPQPPLHRQNSEKLNGLAGRGNSSSVGSTTSSRDSSSYGSATLPAMALDPTPQKLLKMNHNPYTPPTTTSGAVRSAHEAAFELRVPVNTASRYLMDFQTERTLGKGSYGKVELARHRVDGWSYAIKRMRYRPHEYNKEALDTVLNEIFMLASLSHPHIIRYHSAWIEEAPEGIRETEVCIATEYCYGGSLTHWWKQWLHDNNLTSILSYKPPTTGKADPRDGNTSTRRNAYSSSRAPQAGPLPTHQLRTVRPLLSSNLQTGHVGQAASNQPILGFGPVLSRPDPAQIQAAVDKVEDKLCEILKHCCRALRYLHEEKCVVHLDVKPDNIFVQQETLSMETATFKLGDCGSMRKIPAMEALNSMSPRGGQAASSGSLPSPLSLSDVVNGFQLLNSEGNSEMEAGFQDSASAEQHALRQSAEIMKTPRLSPSSSQGTSGSPTSPSNGNPLKTPPISRSQTSASGFPSHYSFNQGSAMTTPPNGNGNGMANGANATSYRHFSAALSLPSSGSMTSPTGNGLMNTPSFVPRGGYAQEGIPALPLAEERTPPQATPLGQAGYRNGHGKLESIQSVPSTPAKTPGQVNYGAPNYLNTPVLNNGSQVPVTPNAGIVLDSDDLDGDGRYLAPELLEFQVMMNELLPKADMYALGCSIVELAHVALMGGSAEMMGVPERMSAAFKDLIHSLMLSDPSLRPSAAEVLTHDLLQTTTDLHMKKEMQRLQERVQQLEQQNQALQSQLAPRACKTAHFAAGQLRDQARVPTAGREMNGQETMDAMETTPPSFASTAVGSTFHTSFAGANGNTHHNFIPNGNFGAHFGSNGSFAHQGHYASNGAFAPSQGTPNPVSCFHSSNGTHQASPPASGFGAFSPPPSGTFASSGGPQSAFLTQPTHTSPAASYQPKFGWLRSSENSCNS